MEQNTDLKELENFRLRVEERLLMPIGRGKRYRKMHMFDPTLSEYINESFTVVIKTKFNCLNFLILSFNPVFKCMFYLFDFVNFLNP